MSAKNLYKCFFKFHHTAYIERCMAHTKRQAYFIVCNRIARAQGVDPQTVFGFFKGGRHENKIEEEIKFEEVDDDEDN